MSREGYRLAAGFTAQAPLLALGLARIGVLPILPALLVMLGGFFLCGFFLGKGGSDGQSSKPKGRS